MYTRHLCLSANESINALAPENSEFTGALNGFAEACSEDGRNILTVSEKDGAKYFNTGSYCGFACFADGTLIEILPDKDRAKGRKALCMEFCSRCGFTFNEMSFDPEMNFLEYFISVFAGETIKIIKSGVLSAYASREENMTSVQGTILFAENIRRNLVHRERLYVRHDVFTPDRAENRIIKSAALMLSKLTADAHSSHLLMEALSFLGEVAVPHDPAAEFGRCINTRNTRKYAATLSICRMLLDKNEGTALLGKDIICGQVYEMS
jgi:5-methylcytosine-specific restriction endonuclease McrBC regulatory subunit McrC